MAPEKLPKPHRKGSSSNHQKPKIAWVCVNVSLFPILGIFGFPWKIPPPLEFSGDVTSNPVGKINLPIQSFHTKFPVFRWETHTSILSRTRFFRTKYGFEGSLIFNYKSHQLDHPPCQLGVEESASQVNKHGIICVILLSVALLFRMFFFRYCWILTLVAVWTKARCPIFVLSFFMLSRKYAPFENTSMSFCILIQHPTTTKRGFHKLHAYNLDFILHLPFQKHHQLLVCERKNPRVLTHHFLVQNPKPSNPN